MNENSHNNNDNNNEIEMIDIDNLKSKTIRELNIVVKSLNLKANCKKKSEIIDIISKYVLNFRNNKQKNEKCINKFNSNINELAVKEIENTEILFWKVFKNKVLFKQIMSPTNFNCRFHKYDDLINVKWLIKNKHINLLIEKIKRNQLLIFGFQAFENIIEIIKKHVDFINNDGDDDNSNNRIEFYEALYKNYQKYIIDFNEIIEISIKAGCLDSIKVIFRNQYYKFNKKNYCASFSLKNEKKHERYSDNGLFDIVIESLLASIQYEKIKVFKFLWEEYVVKLNKQVRVIDELKEKFINMERLSKHPIIKIKSFKFLNHMLDLNEFNETILDIPRKYPSFDLISNYTLIKLIHFCGSFLRINKGQIPSTSTLSIKELKAIQNQFTIKQLKTNIQLLILEIDQQYLKANIKQLLEFYYSANQTQLPINYYLAFGLEIPKEIDWNNQNKPYLYIKDALGYGDYKLVLLAFEYNEMINHMVKDQIEHEYINTEYPNLLFKYCKEDKEKQITFVLELAKVMKSEEYHKYAPNDAPHLYGRMNPILLLYLLMEFDDVELVKLLFNQLGIELINGIFDQNFGYYLQHFGYDKWAGYYLSISNFHRMIKSIPMLDYCYETFKSHFSKRVKSMVGWYALARIDLLERFEQLIGATSCNNKSSTLLLPFYDCNLQCYHKDNDVFEHKFVRVSAYILSKKDIYEYDCSVLNFINIGDNMQSLEDIKFIIENTSTKNKSYILGISDYNLNTRRSMEMINWVLDRVDDCRKTFEINEIVRCKGNLSFNFFLYSLLADKFSTGTFKDNEWFNNKTIVGMLYNNYGLKHFKSQVISFFGNYADIRSLEQIINFYIIPTIDENLVEVQSFCWAIFDKLSTIGALNCFQFIYSKYPRFLTKTSKNGNGIITLAILNDLLKTALKKDQLHLVDFFINTLGITITSTQFNNLKLKENTIAHHLNSFY